MPECETCNGDGRVVCDGCGGAKGEYVEECHDGEAVGKVWVDCPGCNGEGYVDCPDCGGEGIID